MKTPALGQTTIPRRFGGPPGMAQGGYVGGILAKLMTDQPCVEVRLRAPTPLETSLAIQHRGDSSLRLLVDDQVCVEGGSGEIDLDVPKLVRFDEAERAGGVRAWRAWWDHAVERAAPEQLRELEGWEGCFGCSPRRDGLNLFAGKVADREMVATPVFIPPDLVQDGIVPTEIVWAAVDCPSAWACALLADEQERDELVRRGGLMTGGLSVQVRRLPRADESLFVQAWRIGRDGRKLFGGAVLVGHSGEILADARQTAIAL